MKDLIIIRGGGDIATGTIYKLYQCGYPILILECEKPSAIRRNVAFSEAVYEGKQTIENVTCYLAKDVEEAKQMLEAKKLVMLVDSKADSVTQLQPKVVIDAILAKKNVGTRKDMANVVIALGPGFEAQIDCHAVIETMRGHQLGRVIYTGKAIPNTGIPGNIAGVSKERVIHASHAGIFYGKKQIADLVKKGEEIAMIQTEKETISVKASIDGLLRGILRSSYPVTKGFKIADIDPRESEYENCFTISDKARCIAGGVLEAILHLQGK